MSNDLVVFSHLRWDFVFQRPQHLITRLAQERRVFYFEEPIQITATSARIEFREAHPNVIVCQPFTPEKVTGFHDQQLPWLNELLNDTLRQFDIQDWAAWFYTPMALPLIAKHNTSAIIYDCMDELAAFMNAPRQLLQREAALLKVADVVFTGGRSLHQAKRQRHPQVHCYPSSVDTAHFGQARSVNAEPPEQARLPHPRLGFFGVIDERIDLALLDAMARAHPEWQIIMVGPVVKIDPDTLPQHDNITYCGQQPYADLPSYLSGWDICLLPFAMNASTRFISPTKTLEYMAAERMIVSTPITDVADAYGDIVYLGDTHEHFIAACAAALGASAAERQQRIDRMRNVLAHTSWDDSAQKMNDQIVGAIHDKAMSTTSRRTPTQPATSARTGTGVTGSPSMATRASTKTVPVAIIGAGPTGLSAAYHLGEQALVVEQNDRVGGWCRSIEDQGFTFDCAGHIMFSNDPYVHELYEMLLGDNVHWQNREAWVYSKEVYTRYPFQGALYGLPAEVIQECILGAVEARFGPINEPESEPASDTAKASVNSDTTAGKPDSITDCCADGIMESSLSSNSQTLPFKNRRKKPRNFEDFIYETWGAGIAKHFAIPYNQKLWAVPLQEMETSWLGGRVPMPDLADMLEGALKPVGKPMGPNAHFGYPLQGGFQAMMDGFLPQLSGELKLSTRVGSVDPAKHMLSLDDGSVYRYDQLISTMPLPHLIAAMGDAAPKDIQDAAQGLRHVSVRCVNIGVGREHITDKHWVYYPEDTLFHRVFLQGNASPHCNPPGALG